MRVQKRSGSLENISFDKVLQRIRKAARGLSANPDALAQQVLSQIHDGVKTEEIDDLTSQLAASLSTNNPDWAVLASRIAISNHHKKTSPSFKDAMIHLSTLKNSKTGEVTSCIHPSILALLENEETVSKIESKINHERDYDFDYFGFKTLERAYLLRDADRQVVERPQHMWMRVALALWPENLDRAFETYELLSQKKFTHATPTLFNAGTPRQQLSSCFLLSIHDDSIAGIYKTLGDCAAISKYAGGIGLHIHNIRAKGTNIRGTNGTSNGIGPMLRVFNNTARYVDQGGGKRNGSFAIYLEPWHADVEEFIKLKMPTGAEEERARDLFYALWVPDLFMKRVSEDGVWSLFCPDEAPGLADVWGDAFDELYLRYEKEGRFKKQVSAQKLWFQILDAQIETGTPYLVYKDAANRKSNQQNLGTIKSSNLCVAPETIIRIKKNSDLTSFTDISISKLANQEVEIWNGDKWSKVTVKQTGEKQKLLRVIIKTSTSNYNFPENIDEQRKILYCTEYHKFILPTSMNINECERIEAKDLKSGTVLKGYKNNFNKWISQTVESVIFDGRYDDTYCFNEPDNHAGVFNGVLTGNCSEIIEYSSPDETAVCNLASLSLPAFIENDFRAKPYFNYDALRQVTKVATRNLNRVIDINFYPTPETKKSNMRHRPIGLGVQGLADVFALLKLDWETEEAQKVNQLIFEHMYYAAVETSAEIAEEEGAYETFQGSPASKGRLQPDLWAVEPLTAQDGTLNWDLLREKARKGLRNSLLIAPMPTASTSQILGNNECIEPFTSNLYTRRTLAGEFIVVNKYLLNELKDLGIWSDRVKGEMIARNGSVQGIPGIPEDIQRRYKTAWEMKMRTLIDMAARRGAFVCQSQSLNLFVADANYAKLTSMHFYAWQQGLKTGCYYLRTKAPVMAQKFTVDPRLMAAANNEKVIQEEEDSDSDSDSASEISDSSSEDEEQAERTLTFRERLAAAKAAAESGEGCLMCSG